jgi:hypothetical protein
VRGERGERREERLCQPDNTTSHALEASQGNLLIKTVAVLSN